MRAQQHGIVVYTRSDENVMLRPLFISVVAINKQPLDLAMPDAAWVAGVVHSRRDDRMPRIVWSVAGLDEIHLTLREQRRLLEANNVVLLPLVPIDVILAAQ